MLAAFLFLSQQKIYAQCFGGSPFTLMPGQSAVAGGQFTNGFLIASPQYYQPLNYYAPNTMISQPMLVPCHPSFRTGYVPFQHGMQMPNQNPWAQAMPALMGSVGELGSLFTRSDDQTMDFDTFRARRESQRERDRTNPGSNSGEASADRQVRPLEFESRFVELPRSNTAGNLGLGAIDAPDIENRETIQETVETQSEIIEDSPDFIGPPALTSDGELRIPNPDLDLDHPSPTDRVVLPAPAIAGTDYQPQPLTMPEIIEDATPLLAAVEEAQEALAQMPTVGLPPLIDCQPSAVERVQERPALVQGAIDVMNTFYQSCDASEIIIDSSTEINISVLDEVISSRDETRRSLNLENRSRFIEHHPILSQIQPGLQCQNILETPAMFSFGAKPLISRNQGGVQVDLFQNQAERCPSSHIECESLPVIAMDCSGFIQAAMAVSGHRIFPDQRDHQERGTAGFLSAALNPESCLRPAVFEQNSTLAPGDLITVHAHHMYMITDVGPDPLGIQRALERGDCDTLSMNDFDFQFIQSGAAGSIGVARMSSDSAHQSQIIQARLFYQAKKTCFEIQNNQPLSPPMEQTARRTEFMVIRHQGQQRPECLSDPARVTLQGQECLADCEGQE